MLISRLNVLLFCCCSVCCFCCWKLNRVLLCRSVVLINCGALPFEHRTQMSASMPYSASITTILIVRGHILNLRQLTSAEIVLHFAFGIAKRNVLWWWPSVCVSVPGCMHYPDVTLENGSGCPLVVHYWQNCNWCTGFVAMATYMLNAKCQRGRQYSLCGWF